MRFAHAAALACALAGPAMAEDAPLDAVAGFDAARYLGLWHEIAAIPAWFQKSCAAAVTARYEPVADGALAVTNSCLEADGARSVAQGRARFTGDRDVGALEVTFLSVLGLWVWPIAGDYVVIDIDPEYRWSAVGHPSRGYGWVLARAETLDAADLQQAADSFRAAGYDACDILMSPRTLGAPRTPLCEVAPPQ